MERMCVAPPRREEAIDRTAYTWKRRRGEIGARAVNAFVRLATARMRRSDHSAVMAFRDASFTTILSTQAHQTTMPWPWSSSSTSGRPDDTSTAPSLLSPASTPSSSDPSPWHAFLSPSTLVPAALMTTAVLGGRRIYKAYLRRIPVATAVPARFWRRRSLLGRVTSVGDGDGFRLYHTPGGRLAGWDWARAVPTKPKELKDQTISVRLAAVDAPEMAHFGRPEQPFAKEAYDYLTNLVQGKRVRVYLHKRDQYERAVGTAYIRRPPFFRRKDVSMELLKQGLATVYEGKTGAEFGGETMEREYREVQDRVKKMQKGMWAKKSWAGKLGLKTEKERESPMEYKRRMAAGSGAEGKNG